MNRTVFATFAWRWWALLTNATRSLCRAIGVGMI